MCVCVCVCDRVRRVVQNGKLSDGAHCQAGSGTDTAVGWMVDDGAHPYATCTALSLIMHICRRAGGGGGRKETPLPPPPLASGCTG